MPGSLFFSPHAALRLSVQNEGGSLPCMLRVRTVSANTVLNGLPLLVALCTLAAIWPFQAPPFQRDDFTLGLALGFAKSEAPAAATSLEAETQAMRPLSHRLLCLEARITGARPGSIPPSSRILGLALHVLLAIVAAFLGRTLIKGGGLAMAMAILVLLHPWATTSGVRLETRAALIATIFAGLSLSLFAASVRPGRTLALIPWFFGILSALAALLCHEGALGLPLGLLAVLLVRDPEQPGRALAAICPILLAVCLWPLFLASFIPEISLSKLLPPLPTARGEILGRAAWLNLKGAVPFVLMATATLGLLRFRDPYGRSIVAGLLTTAASIVPSVLVRDSVGLDRELGSTGHLVVAVMGTVLLLAALPETIPLRGRNRLIVRLAALLLFAITGFFVSEQRLADLVRGADFRRDFLYAGQMAAETSKSEGLVILVSEVSPRLSTGERATDAMGPDVTLSTAWVHGRNSRRFLHITPDSLRDVTLLDLLAVGFRLERDQILGFRAKKTGSAEFFDQRPEIRRRMEPRPRINEAREPSLVWNFADAFQAIAWHETSGAIPGTTAPISVGATPFGGARFVAPPNAKAVLISPEIKASARDALIAVEIAARLKDRPANAEPERIAILSPGLEILAAYPIAFSPVGEILAPVRIDLKGLLLPDGNLTFRLALDANPKGAELWLETIALIIQS